MRRTPQLLLALALAASAPVAPTQAPAQAPAQAKESRNEPHPGLALAKTLESGFANLAERLYPQVATVRGYVKQPNGGAVPREGAKGWVASAITDDYPGFAVHGAGSGFFVGENGDLLTCLHFLQREDGSMVDLIDIETSDQRHFIAALVGAEPSLNLAVVRFAVTAKGYPPQFAVAKLGNSAAIAAGHFALGVGNPPGPEKFFSVGHFTTGPSRDCYQEMLTAFYLQATLHLHDEAYGGPIVNLDGEVLGMLSPRQPAPGPLDPEPDHGIEFALPSNVIQGLYKSIAQTGSVRSPWLGFSVMSRPELIKEKGIEAFNAMAKPQQGIFIENVFDPSPAAKAGIQPGDFLVQFDEHPIPSPIEFQKRLYLGGIGKDVVLTMFRDGELREVPLRIEERPKNAIQK